MTASTQTEIRHPEGGWMTPDPALHRRSRRALALAAGLGRVSLLGVVTGVLSAYGITALLGAVAASAGVAAADLLSARYAPEELVLGGLVAGGLVILAACLLGGYVAGRVAWRSGALNGLLVGVTALAVAAAIGVTGWMAAGDRMPVLDLEAIGRAAAAAATAIVALAVLGGLSGGWLGERWHDRLIDRALDVRVGPAARARRDAEERLERAHRALRDAEKLTTSTRLALEEAGADAEVLGQLEAEQRSLTEMVGRVPERRPRHEPRDEPEEPEPSPPTA